MKQRLAKDCLSNEIMYVHDEDRPDFNFNNYAVFKDLRKKKFLGLVNRYDIAQPGRIFADLMSDAPVHSVHLDTPVEICKEQMRFFNVDILPVVDDNKDFQGVVTYDTIYAPDLTFNKLTAAKIKLNSIDQYSQPTLQHNRTNSQNNYHIHYDALTNRPNRQFMVECIRLSIAREKRLAKQNLIGCFVLNINDFKKVNRTFGRKTGDLFLKEVARSLAEMIEDKDTLGCYEGDTFVIASTALNDENDIVILLKKCVDVFSKPFIIQGREIAITCSIGISSYPEDGQNAEELLKNAEAVMYSAKSRGYGNNVLFYSDKIHINITKLLTLAVDLEGAVKRDELQL